MTIKNQSNDNNKQQKQSVTLTSVKYWSLLDLSAPINVSTGGMTAYRSSPGCSSRLGHRGAVVCIEYSRAAFFTMNWCSFSRLPRSWNGRFFCRWPYTLKFKSEMFLMARSRSPYSASHIFCSCCPWKFIALASSCTFSCSMIRLFAFLSLMSLTLL